MTSSQEPNWWDDLPTVKSAPPRVDRHEVAAMVASAELVPGKDYLVVDVRRNDHDGGHVKHSEQHPAQSFYPTISKFVDEKEDIPKVFFYCNRSNGRGPRIAGWYQDALDERGITSSKAYVLDGGIAGWVESFGKDDRLTQDFDEELWKSKAAQ